MSDGGDWPNLVHMNGHYTMVPLNEYQMGNLVAALAQVREDGDWWSELLSIIWKAMDVAGIQTLRANNGRVFTRDQIYTRDIREVAWSINAL